MLLAISKSKEFIEFENLYFKSIEAQSQIEIGEIDWHIFTVRITNAMKLHDFQEARTLIDCVNKRRSSSNLQSLPNFALIDFLDAQISYLQDRNDESKYKSTVLLGFIDKLLEDGLKATYLDELNLTELKNNVNELLVAIDFKLGKPTFTTNFRSRPKIGRNDQITVRYKDGRVITAKFKKLERDLANGICDIVE